MYLLDYFLIFIFLTLATINYYCINGNLIVSRNKKITFQLKRDSKELHYAQDFEL